MKFLNFFLFSGIAFLLYASCKKSSTTNPVATSLMGKWKYNYFVADSNGNHVMDAHDAIDTVNNPYTMEYYPDGTGAYLLNNATVGSFTWQLLNNNTYLKVSSATSGTATQHIDSLTAKKLIIKDTTGISYTWQVYTKA